MIGILDCNNFYVSCERLFDPSLRRKPVVVLSNNDGCVIARSAEAKELNIEMGMPAGKALRRKGGDLLEVRSSNYALYADLSDRVMSLLGEQVPLMEVYSIDEAFFEIPTGEKDPVGFLEGIKKHIEKCTGIPVTLGAGQTRTIAKMAVRYAKSNGSGVCQISGQEELLRLTGDWPVGQIWGIGEATDRRLGETGCRTVKDFLHLDPVRILKNFPAPFFHTREELEGMVRNPLIDQPQDRKSVSCSRSFSVELNELSALKEAIIAFATLAAEKLRKRNMKAGKIAVYIASDRYSPGLKAFRRSSVVFPVPVDRFEWIVSNSVSILEKIYSKKYLYRKAGVELSELTPRGEEIRDLFQKEPEDAGDLSRTLESLRSRFGKEAVHFGIQDRARPAWKTRFARKSPSWTTSWDELPGVGDPLY